MNYDMGRDIGMALEDLKPFNFKAVRPRLNVLFETPGVYVLLLIVV